MIKNILGFGTLIAVLFSCSPGAPTSGRVAIDVQSDYGVRLVGHMLEFEVAAVEDMAKMAAIANSIEALTRDPSIDPDLSAFPDADMEKTISQYRSAVSQRDSAYQAWLAGKKNDLSLLNNQLNELAMKEESYLVFVAEPKAVLDRLNEEVDSLEGQMQQIARDVISHTNLLIVEEMLSVRQLPANRNALAWTVRSWREGTNLANVACDTTPPSLTLDRIEIDGTCLHVERPVEELASPEYDAFLVQQLDSYVNLSSQVGQSSYRPENNTGLRAEIVVAEDALEEATILAENQTGINARQMQSERQQVEGRKERLEREISQVAERAAQGIYPHEISRNNNVQSELGARSELNGALDVYRRSVHNEIADRHFVHGSSVGADGRFSGLDGGADVIVAVVEAKVSNGLFDDTVGGAKVVSVEELDLDEEGNIEMIIGRGDVIVNGFGFEGGFSEANAVSRALYELEQNLR